MNIAIIGYGKMGKIIEKIAIDRGHRVILKITTENIKDMTEENLKSTDVAIEFTNPNSAFDNIIKCFSAGINVVSGTTGWNQEMEKTKQLAITNHLAFLYASNFSIGVNIFFEINKKLAQLMATHSEYKISLEETHHTLKKDAPSGTAITLAEQILNEINLNSINSSPIRNWQLQTDEIRHDESILPINSIRKDPVPGTHHVKYSSLIDDIEIIHTAHNRDGFAFGAVLAAEFIFKKIGVFNMADVLKMQL